MSSSSSGSSSGSSSTIAVQQVARPEALCRRHGDGVAEAEAVRVVGERHVLDVVDLVGRDEDGQLGAAQEVGDLLVAGAHARAGVDDEHRGLRVGERGLRLFADRPGDRVEVVLVHRRRCRRA